MNERLLHTMGNDMQILPYKNETRKLYASRVIYSALAHWIRYSIYDDMPEKGVYKSKAYILSKGKEVFEGFLVAFPECKEWYDAAKSFDIDSDPIRDIRSKMLNAGELYELDNDLVCLPEVALKYGDEGISRILGFDTDQTQRQFFVGVTRLIVTHTEFNGDMVKKFWDPNLIDKKIVWSDCSDMSPYEFFDAHALSAPYKSWTEKQNKKEIVLGRTTLYNDYHEYYLFKYEEGKWHFWPLPETLTKYKEERRLISYLKQRAGNAPVARIEFCNSAYILKLGSRLPLFEEAYIETFCWPLNCYNDKLNYVVPLKMWDAIKKILADNLYFIFQEETSYEKSRLN